MTFLSRYQDRQSTLKVDHEITNNGRSGKVHSLNDFHITVWEDGEVTAQRKYYASSDPKTTFPNMSVSDGAVTFPIEDLISFIIARISVTELAEGIISDDEARTALIDKLAERYNSPGFDDQDRRRFLTAVQQQIYAIAVDRAIERLNYAEETLRAKHNYYRWRKVEAGHYRTLYERYKATLYELREAGKIDDVIIQKRLELFSSPDTLDTYIESHRDPIVSESAGPNWTESRNFWREHLLKYFPEPTEN